jgi:uncharacterized protein (DUF433 family)
MSHTITTIEVSAETFDLLERRASELGVTPDEVADAALRLQLGAWPHIEHRRTRWGEEPYLRGTRVAVRHVASFLKAGHSIEQIIHEDLPDEAPAAILEAVAYYYDHAGEIDAELDENEPDAVYRQLREGLSADQYDALTGRSA